MARARNIKPGLFKNELLGVADPLVTILFESLWCLADREGRLEDRPLRIKAETFPYRDGVSVDAFLNDLQAMGFIVRYAVNGQALIQITNFKKHQTPHSTEKPSELPGVLTQALPLNNAEITQALPPDSLIPDSLNLIPDSLQSDPKRTKERNECAQEFEEAWAAYPKRPGASKKETFKQWCARLKSGADVHDLLAGVYRYSDYVSRLQIERNFIKLPSTFFGPGEHYKSDWTMQHPARAGPYESARDRSRRETNEALTGKKQHDDHRTIDI